MLPSRLIYYEIYNTNINHIANYPLLQLIKHLHNHNAIISSSACAYAAENNHLEIVKYIYIQIIYLSVHGLVYMQQQIIT
jgi:hypothetical protein